MQNSNLNEIIARILSDINETKFSTGVSDERIKVRMTYTLAHRLMTHRDTAFSPQLNSPYPTIFGYEVEPYNAPDNEVSYKIMVEWFYKLIEKGKYDNAAD